MIATVVTETNLVGDPKKCVMDTGTSRHFCANRNLFKEFEEIPKGEQVFMGNSSVGQEIGRGKVEFKLSSGKILWMSNVLYVASMRRNLIS